MSIVPTQPKGPPLNALRAFEAAARHESFLSAAKELSVTPGAIAQHIKSLEAWARCDLFERQANGIRLTNIGRSLLPRLSAGFDLLGIVAQDLRRLSAPTECRIATLPSLAQLWLLPLLPKLRSALPNLTISITALEEVPNLVRDPFDIALFFDIPSHVGTTVTVLSGASCFPVCAPALARRLNTIDDLGELPLLHDAAWRGHWAEWLERSGATHVDSTRGAIFSLYSLALEEAKNGAGVLMGRDPLVREALRTKALVRPFSIAINQASRLTVSMRSDQRVKTADKKLVQWLTRQCRRLETDLGAA